MYGSDDYMDGYYDGQNNPLPDFRTLRNINQLKANNRSLVEANQILQNDVNNLLNERKRLKEAFLKVAEQCNALEDLIKGQKERIDRITFLSSNFLLSYRIFTDEEFQQKEAYRKELKNLIYGLRKTFLEVS